MVRRGIKTFWTKIRNNSQWVSPPPAFRPRKKIAQKRSLGAKIILYGYTATVILSATCLIVFPFIKGAPAFWSFTFNALGKVIFISISSWPHIVPFFIFAEVWNRRLKSRDHEPNKRQRWIILGGASGIVWSGVVFWWIVFWEFWDIWFLGQENPDPTGTGQAIAFGAIFSMPPLIGLGVFIGAIIGIIAGDHEENPHSKIPPAILFITLAVLVVIMTSLLLISYWL